jgi:hypothetical protein
MTAKDVVQEKWLGKVVLGKTTHGERKKETPIIDLQADPVC